jgi:hypothetical protein
MVGIDYSLTEANYDMTDANYWLAEGKDGIIKAS